MSVEPVKDKTFYIIDMESRFIKELCKAFIDEGHYIRVLAWYDPYIRADFERNYDYIDGVVISGSPHHVISHTTFPVIDDYLLNQRDIPVLGVCYGMQIINYLNKGWVVKNKKTERGPKKLEILKKSKLFDGVDMDKGPCAGKVWMQHDYIVDNIPPKYKITSSTKQTPIASFERKNIYGVQFHPEYGTGLGKQIIHNFCEKIC